MAMRFHDRIDAGKQLAAAVEKKYRGADAVVYPLPRGGVPLGIEVARALSIPLDLVIPRKIGHPYNPEYAICAVAECGETVCNERERERVDQTWFEQRVNEERRESKRRRELYLAGRKPVPVEGKTAILVDDGIATGLTMRAAIRDMRARKASHVVVAIPVVPQDTAERLATEVDDVVALSIDAYYLGAVGAYYDDFSQVSDTEVMEMMKQLDQQGKSGEA